MKFKKKKMFSLKCISIIIIIKLLFVSNNESHDNYDNYDESDDNSNLFHEKSKYLAKNNENFVSYEKWQKYYDLIRNAKQTFNELNVSLNRIDGNSCDCYLNLLENDLIHWNKSGISEDLIEEAIRLKRGVHYQIIDHKLYREKECLFPSRCEGVEHFILKAIDWLPNMDLIINVRDYPQVHKSWNALPVFSFSKDITQYKDVTYPAWTFWCGGPAIDRYPVGIGRWDQMRERIVKNAIDWTQKSSVAFFRGSRTSSDRDPLILMSRSKPDVIDAKYTANQAWRSLADTLGAEPVSTVSFEDHCKYKYLFNMRGVAASFRYKHLFLCKSLVLNVDSNWIEFFYQELKPWIHFVPIAKDYSDVEEILTFLKENDEIAHNIANEGFDFIWNYLTLDSVQCYWNKLLEKYANLLKYNPKLNVNLFQIKS